MVNRAADKNRHLGRGLESLLGPMSSESTDSKKIQSQDLEALKEPSSSSQDGQVKGPVVRLLPVTMVNPNPYQARKYWDDSKLQELASSIAANGVVQPIVVRRMGTGYQIIAGERRFRASQMIGKDTVPALIKDATDGQMHEWALVENIHRANLNPIERANAYEAYIKAFDLTQSEAAKRLGEDRSVVANHLRILDLPNDLKQMLIDEKLMMGHARAILSLPSDDLRRKLANKALAGRLSVREVERLVREYLANQEEGNGSKEEKKVKPPHILELEDLIKVELGSRVRIETNKSGKRGKLVIEFKSLDDFDRLLDKIGINTEERF